MSVIFACYVLPILFSEPVDAVFPLFLSHNCSSCFCTLLPCSYLVDPVQHPSICKDVKCWLSLCFRRHLEISLYFL
uniref:Secreted protein n=1 Tax=Setaria viridis TaxID=4556 RepID=A0A4U6VLS0_SETVI|nr:hypothetical protein SEVIR_2G052350v2 [Setaria viridis]